MTTPHHPDERHTMSHGSDAGRDPALAPEPHPGKSATKAAVQEARHANWGFFVLLCAILDVVLVAVFAMLSAASHGGADPANLWRIGWPFLVGLAVGWALPFVHRHPWLLWPAGVVVWLTTTVLGLAVRVLAGGGISGAMPWITAGTFAVLLLGARLITGTIARRTGIERGR